MFLHVLRAIKVDLCQAEEGEILVPNPMVLRGVDSDYFVGIRTRRPARFGRVAAEEGVTSREVAAADQTGVFGSGPPEEWDEERRDDVLYFLDVLSEFEVGTVVGCAYTWEEDEVTWDLFEVDEQNLPE